MSESFIDRMLGTVISDEIIRPELNIPLGFKREYYKELVHGGEVFINRDDFIATSEFSDKVDLLYLKSFNLSKRPGIYIIYNSEFLYTGQSATGIIERLADHQSKVDKAHLMEKGRVLFFGKTDGSIGKDQLDHIEKFLIKLFKSGRRETVNDKAGNTSYCSIEHRNIAEYLLEFVYYTAFVSKSNPFKEEEIRDVKRAGGEAEKFDWSEMVKFLSGLDTVKMEKEFHLMAKREFKDLVFIEYNWPTDNKGEAKPIERIGSSSPFYLESRDGAWPEDFEEIKAFEHDLLEEYRLRKKKLQSLQ